MGSTTFNKPLADETAALNGNLAKCKIRTGTYNIYGIVCKQYWGQWQAVFPLHNAGLLTITVNSLNIATGNGDPAITTWDSNYGRRQNSLTLGFTSSTDYTGCMCYANITVS